MEIERFAQLMVNLEGLTGEQRREAKARLEVLEAHADSERLIRERLGTPVGCPHCAGTEVVRFGHANGRQRYRCKSCGRTFVALTGTPLMRLREPDKLLAYAACMSEGMTIRASAREVGLTLDRSFRWRHKFLSWIADQKPQGLTGLVEADETFFPKSYKGQRQEMPRPPRKRGGRRQVGSRSRDTGEESVPDEPPVPVVVALQRGTRLTHDAVLPGRDAASLTVALRPALGPDAVLSTDGNSTYGVAARTLGIAADSFVARYHGPGGHGVWHIQNVNAYHSRLKSWMDRFHGVATKYLDHYLGWRRLLDRYHDAVTGEQFLFHALRRAYINI